MKYLLSFSALLLLIQVPSAQESTKPPSAFTVRGQVIQIPENQPIKKANIQLMGYNSGERSNYSAVSDTQGKFEIDDVKPGTYTVFLDRTGFVDARRKFRERSLVLRAGEQAEDLVLPMYLSAVVTGKILDGDGDPMPNVTVNAQPYGVKRRHAQFAFGYASTNDLGEFRMAGLLPGRYLISAAPGVGRPQVTENDGAGKDGTLEEKLFYTKTFYPGSADETQAQAIEVTPGAEIPVSFSLVTSRAYRVRGTVAVPKGSSAFVLLRSQDDEGRSYNPDIIGPDGAFEFINVLPGSYVATTFVTSFPDIKNVAYGDASFEVNDNVDGLHLEPAVNGSVRGRFRVDGDQKADWSRLTVFLSTDEFGRRARLSASFGGSNPPVARVKSDGSFEINDVRGGTYHVTVGSEDESLRDYFTKAVNLDGKDISDSGLTIRGSTYSLDVVVSAKGATIEGVALDDKEHPVSDAKVACIPSVEHRKRPDLFRQETTDKQGHFSLRGLMQGEYTVLAWEDLQDDIRDPEFLKSVEASGQHVRLEEGERKTVQVKVMPEPKD